VYRIGAPFSTRRVPLLATALAHAFVSVVALVITPWSLNSLKTSGAEPVFRRPVGCFSLAVPPVRYRSETGAVLRAG